MMNNIDQDFIGPLLKKCGQISLKRHSKVNFSNNKKKDDGFVTDVDTEIGKYIYSQISTKYPNDSIDCEDGPQKKVGGSKYVWYVDPLDGTTNYIHGLPFFAISISSYDKQNSLFLASGIYIPYYGQLFTVFGTKNPELNGKKINVSSVESLKKSLILAGMSFNVGEDEREVKAFVKISCVSAGTRRSGSAAFDLCYVAAGFADAYYHFNLKPWDIAAGSHLVKNAGGLVSNIKNSDVLDLSEGTILATNGFLHRELKRELTKKF